MNVFPSSRKIRWLDVWRRQIAAILVAMTFLVGQASAQQESELPALTSAGLAKMLAELEPEGRFLTVASIMQTIGRSDARQLPGLFDPDNAVWPQNISRQNPELDGPIWQAFFESAVIVPGTFENARPVIGFFNPILDIWLLTQWQQNTDVPRLVAIDVTFTSRIADPLSGVAGIDPSPAWVNRWSSDGLVDAFQDQGRNATEAFISQYDGTRGRQAVLSPSTISQKVGFSLLHARAALMAASLAKVSEDSVHVELVETVLDGVAKGDVAALTGLDQLKNAIFLQEETLSLPELTRVSFVPTAAITTKDGFAVISSSAATPSILLVLEARGKGKASALSLLAPFDAIGG